MGAGGRGSHQPLGRQRLKASRECPFWHSLLLVAGSGCRPAPLAGCEGLVIPGPESGKRVGLARDGMLRVGVADRPVVGDGSVLESVGRERRAH
ncbi:MAG: hypothetical protein KatS3mg054_0787 [Chloroflexus sp.]|jgi:hypothetical protein|nr:MAG: hypothetical protein KatS3mg054_0787 [Chloroflexus sp.]